MGALQHILNRLAVMENEVKLDQAIQNYSLNNQRENFFRDVLNFIAANCKKASFLHGCDFENLNFTEPNAAHIDLVDKNKKLAFQITSTKTAEKIRNTLEVLSKPEYSGYDIKIFYLLGKPILTKKVVTSLNSHVTKTNKSSKHTNFNVTECLFDSTDLLREIKYLDGRKIIELKEKYFHTEKEVVPVQELLVLLTTVEELKDTVEKSRKRCQQSETIPDLLKDLSEDLQNNINKLNEAEKNLATFKRGVLALTEYFAKTPINTERLRKAKAAFETGDYQAARQILNTKEMAQEQTALLERQQQLQTQQAEVAEQLANSATEYVFKAQLTAIDYSLPDRIEQTIALFETALKSARKPEHLFDYAGFLQDQSLLPESKIMYEEALTAFLVIGDKERVGVTLNNLGEIHRLRGELDQAWSFYEQSLAISQEIGDKEGGCATLNNMGLIAYEDALSHADGVKKQDLLKLAQGYYQESLMLMREIGCKNSEGSVLNGLGHIAQIQGDPATALDYYLQSLTIRCEVGDIRGAGTVLHSLGNVTQNQGDNSTALNYYLQSLAIRRKTNDKVGLCTTLLNIGHFYLKNGKPELAIQHWRESYQIANQIGYTLVLCDLKKLNLPNHLIN